MSRRTARSATWQNDDGSLTVRQYAAPQFFQPSGSTSWTPIDTTLAKASTAARWNTRANSWSASFGPTGSDGGAEQVTTGTDRIGFDPASPTAAVTPTVAGSTATYRDVWPSTNLVEQVRADSVAESLVLADASAPTSFSFAVSGATVTGSAEGGARLTVDGASAREIPAPTVSLAGHKRAGAMNSGVRLAVSGSSVSVSVSSVWLAGLPASAFPVVIDPSYSPPTNSTATSVVSYSSDGRSTTAAAQVGYDASGLWAGAAHIPLPAPPAVQTGQQPWVLQDAVLDGICGTPAPGRCKIDDEEVFGESGQPTSYVGIGRGQLLYEADGQQGIEAVGVTQWIVANPSGSWFGVAGVGYDCPDAEDCADSVVSLPAANLNLSVIYYQEPPPPTVVSPVAGTMIATATPTLTASTPDTAICAFEGQVANSAGVQCDQPAGVKYDFQVSTAPNGEGQTVADSGWIPQYFTLGTTQTSQGYPITVGNTSGVVPAGALVDGGTYYVTVLDADSEQNPYAVPAQEHQIPPAAALPSTMFTVKCRLGAGGRRRRTRSGLLLGRRRRPARARRTRALRRRVRR